MSIVSHALTTTARQKIFLEIRSDNAKYDSVLDTLINHSTDSIESFCSRRFLRTAYTNQVHDGTGSEELILQEYPVIEDQTFTLQERNSLTNEDDWDTIDAEDYFVEYDTGIVKNVVGIFLKHPRHYRVTYTAGFHVPQDNDYTEGDSESLPNDLEMACNLLTAKIFRQLRRSGSGIEEAGASDTRIRYNKGILLDPVIKSILEKYKRMDI